MASEDFQTFLEDRLRALDPTIDLEAGSPAQVQFIAPVLTRLGTDPFETDIDSFITDRFKQEFPDLYAGDPSVIRDVFVKPLILLLEPFKREIDTIKRNQSLQDPSILSDEDADAIVANVFEERTTGGHAVGVVRVFYQNPTNVQVEINTRFFTATGLNYFPSNPVAVTAEEMVFNRSGSLYFMDVPVKAEEVGAEYNIDAEEISGVVGLYGIAKVMNPRRFTDGKTQIDTPSFVASARQALTERSLVTRRGASARVRSVFQNDVRAVQVIGAKDVEMQRDILVAESPGHAWLLGQVSLYGNVALVQCRIVDSSSTTTSPKPGDTLFVYLDKYLPGFASLEQSKRMLRFKVEEVLAGPMQDGLAPFQVDYFVRWSGTLPEGVTLPPSLVAEGGFSKKGSIKISSLPSVGSVDLSVNNQEVHVYGHTDIYVRPVLQTTSKSVLRSLVDDPQAGQFKIHRTTLTTAGGDAGNQNRVLDPGFDFEANGVVPGDVLVIETGDDAGSYTIGKVTGGTPSYLHLTQALSKSATDLRYRILKRVHLNPFEPKIPKIPFGDVPNNDLQTTIGSDVFIVSLDLLDYGVEAGDVLRILGGVNEGDYTIVGFNGAGQQVIVDRPAGGSEINQTYEVFTQLERVERPLVRVKHLLVLDSAQQSTDIVVPPADPVAVVPTCDFTAAQVRGVSQRASGFVLPSLTASDGSDNFVTGGNVAASSGDRRYSLGFDPSEGIYKAMLFPNGAQAEFDFPNDAAEGCSYFLATSEDTSKSTNYPPVDPKPGDSLTIKTGPNAGSYLIEKVRKFKYQTAAGNSVWLYFLKIYGTFPVDVFRHLISFLDDHGVPVEKITNGSGTISFPDFFVSSYQGLGAKLHTALTGLGATSPGAAALQSAIESVTKASYEWGDPARGTVRSYFLAPTVFEQRTAKHKEPTIFQFKTESGQVLSFRPDPNRYQEHEIIPPRLRENTDPLEYYRDLSAATALEPTFTNANRPSMFAAGVRPGDVLSVHPEILFHGSLGLSSDRMTAVQTTAGSAVVTAPSASGAVFTEEMVGNLLFLEEGADKGGYRVTKVISPSQVSLDRPLGQTTPAITNIPGITSVGNGASWGYDGVDNKVTMPSSQGWSSALVDKYLTLYGIDSAFQGSYKITSVPDTQTLVLERPAAAGNFPAFPQGNGYWVITDAPSTAPKVVGTSTELHGLRPIRMYDDVPTSHLIEEVEASPSTSKVIVDAEVSQGVRQPYRVYRENLRRVNSTEMSDNRDGAFYYFDTEAVSLGANSTNNIPKGSYLTLKEGTFDSLGYRHKVDDSTLSFSMRETGSIEVSLRVLPVESADSLDNYLSIVQAPIEIAYERADVVQQLQEFLDSPEDRVTAANMLARHFLPAYVSYDAEYEGGSAPSVIAEDITQYIDNLPIETPIDVSEMQHLIEKRGGNPETPTTVSTVIHDWDRKMWAEFSQNEVGLSDLANPSKSSVPYNGSPRVSYFVPGPDRSGQDEESGERIRLTRL